MGIIARIAFAVLAISFMTFVTFFGRLPIFRNTPIAWLHRAIWIYLPNTLSAIDQRLTSGRVTSYTSRTWNYMMYDKHPTILIFFFLLLCGSQYMYLPAAWPHFTTFNKVVGSLAIILPYLFLYLSAYTDPGEINPSNHARAMAQYPYDFSLFLPGVTCQTCRLLKPARSKHCSVCKRCISKMDHHCIFINNCVGAGNQHWFVLLLLTTGLQTLYGGVLGAGIIAAKVRTRYPGWSVWPWGNGAPPFKQYLLAWGWGIQDKVGMGAVTMLALLTSPLVWGLLAYHAWLIYCGTTTNESMKWSDWQADMDDGTVFRRKLPADRAKDPRVEPVWTRWPVEAEQIIVRTDDGKPPQSKHPLPGVGEWEPAWRLRDVENLYDLGLWDNLLDVFFPGYSFRDQEFPVAEQRGRKRRTKKTQTETNGEVEG
ncbi:zf-DHHC-domain-containing protein [Coniochaeta ligniaria NRRL 30616]|uniref:Palmitoyltransferase n=1 Tax=Coniochaeta ligniaria NRRL 30616 TaxID=1408157 RepID=A0A1J7J640_9PEZI|nr:zf-DHHC-domain-containing protein [Coniochaeta ligniaria NRRL 30616]